MEQQSIEGYLRGMSLRRKWFGGIRPGEALFRPHIRGGLKEGILRCYKRKARKVQKDAERIVGGYFFREDRSDWGDRRETSVDLRNYWPVTGRQPDGVAVVVLRL